MRKIRYEKFTSTAPVECRTPPMRVEVLEGGKQTEEFSVPGGFRLEQYVASLYPKSQISMCIDYSAKPHGTFRVEVFHPIEDQPDVLITVEEIARDLHIAQPDIVFVGHYTKESFASTLAKATEVTMEYRDKHGVRREVKVDPKELRVLPRPMVDPDDESGAGHA